MRPLLFHKKKQKGFTLIELLVVVAIIGILAAIGVATFGGFQGAAKANATKSIHNQVAKFIRTNVMQCAFEDEVIIPTCYSCIRERTPYGGYPNDATICNGCPLTNMNWIFEDQTCLVRNRNSAPTTFQIPLAQSSGFPL